MPLRYLVELSCFRYRRWYHLFRAQIGNIMTETNRALGLASAFAVIIIWSGFIVVSRAGVTTGLTPYDVAALRFGVAGLVSIPFAILYWPRHLPWHAQVMIALTGPGILYSLMMYMGLSQASAAYGGVFANGVLPLVTMLFMFFLAKELPSRGRMLGAAVIMIGAFLVAWHGLQAGGRNLLVGITMFLCAAAVLSVYMTVLKRWQATPQQILGLVNVVNAAVFLPIWFWFLPSTMEQVSTGTLVFQGLFQGLGPGFAAAIFFALATVHLGPTPTAGFSAAVPASAAVLAIPVLGEALTALEWVGVAVVTLGLFIVVRAR